MQARQIPPCARPEVVPDQASLDAVLLSLQKIRSKLGDYGLPADDVTELSWMARTALEDPQPFQWDPAHVEILEVPRERTTRPPSPVSAK